jgi:amidase
VPAARADHDPGTDTITVNGKQVDPMLGWVMTYPFNILSRCPVLAVPSGRAGNRVPTGIQIVGRTYDDVSVFRAGAALETLRPMYDCADNRPQL